MKPAPTRQEFGRKAVHIAMGVIPATIAWAPPPWSWRGPVFAFCAILALDLARLLHPGLRRWAMQHIGSALRPREHHGLISVHYMTGAAVLLSACLPPPLAATAVGYSVFGDAAAALVGRRWGRHRYGAKSFEGSAACLVACELVGWVFLPERPLAVWAAAIVATVIEALPLPVDDNWSMPLAAGAVLALLV